MSQRRYLVLGDPILDAYVRGRVARVSTEGEFPVYEQTDVGRTVLGGSLNVALALASASPGASIRVVCPPFSLEGDGGESEVRRQLSAAGVVLTEIARPAILVRPLLRKTRYLAGENGPILFCVEPPRRGYYEQAAEAVRETVALLAEGGSVFDDIVVTDYGAGIVTSRLMRDLRTRFPAARISLDPHVSTEPHVCAAADVVKMNAVEFAAAHRGRDPQFFQFSDPDRPTRRVEMVVTDGEEKIRLQDATGTVSFLTPPASVRVVDSCGAGDVFFAYYVAGRATETVRRSASIAAVAAYLTLGHRGNFIPTAVEVADAHRVNERFAFP